MIYVKLLKFKETILCKKKITIDSELVPRGKGEIELF